MTILFTNSNQFARWRRELENATLGFVPTMGALHSGHAELINKAKNECEIVTVSIYVNDLQFNSDQDFSRYPRTLDADFEICRDLDVDSVLSPQKTDLLSYRSKGIIEPSTAAANFEGTDRPGHFSGVVTVVDALFSCVSPTKAYFGIKDYQQLCVIRDMAGIYHPQVEIIPCPTVRDDDGLALSSRNQFLDSDSRSIALSIPRSLDMVIDAWRNGVVDARLLEQIAIDYLKPIHNIDLQYIAIVRNDSMTRAERVSEMDTVIIAAIVNGIRLIDNKQLVNA